MRILPLMTNETFYGRFAAVSYNGQGIFSIAQALVSADKGTDRRLLNNRVGASNLIFILNLNNRQTNIDHTQAKKLINEGFLYKERCKCSGFHKVACQHHQQ
jgi:hypothetical protein